MSRIERALEKAAKLRNNTGSDNAVSNIVSSKENISSIEKVEIKSPYIITVKEPDSPISEEYRKLKSMVVKLTKKSGFKNTLMVTSAMAGEGKSITALNLAVTLSQEYDHTVILMDADIRKPSLSGLLNITPRAGLTECLVDGLNIGTTLVKTDIGRLSFLPSGRRVNNPVELLSSQRLKEVVNEAKHRYSDRYIIIDTPPVLYFAEAHSISSIVDGVILVVKEGMASMQSIRDTLDILKGSNILGIVYNNVSIENLNGRYNYYYHYRYTKSEKGDE